MFKHSMRYLVIIFALILTMFCGENLLWAQDSSQNDSKPDITLELYMRDGICRSRSSIMMDLLFTNVSIKPKKLCVYMFYDSLIKLDLKDSRGEKVQFEPKLLKAGDLTDKDWVVIPPKRTYKRTFSLTRKVINATGHRLEEGNYSIKAIYDGCSKFDPDISDESIESNLLYFLITD